jgi:hypothetical protein
LVIKRLLAANERSQPLEDALWQLTTGEGEQVRGRQARGRAVRAMALLGLDGEDPDGRVAIAASVSARRGFTAVSLAQAVPRAAGWRLSWLPRALED